MGQTGNYFLAQIKRAGRLLPGLLIVNLCVCACVGALAYLLVSQGALSAGGTRYRIGIVGDLSDSYLGFGITAVQTMDDSRLMIELVEMSEEEAEEAFSRGDLYAIMRVPDGLMESIVSGENDRLITYTATQGQKGLGTMVMGEIVDLASTLVTRSQSAIYGMQWVLAEEGRREEIAWETDRLNLMLINMVLSRSGFSEVEVVGYSQGLSLELYYFCSIILLILLLSGLLNSAFFARRPAALSGFVRARGVGAVRQILSEYLTYLFLMLVSLFCLACLIVFGLKRRMISVPEWEGMGVAPFWSLLVSLLPVVAMFAALQFFLYEAAEGIVNGILLQLLCGVGMGYLSGYFYPAAFFPERMRLVGEMLPSGAAQRFVEAGVLQEAVWHAGMTVFLYLAGFLVLAAALRHRKILTV